MTPQNLYSELKEVLKEAAKDIEWKDLDGKRTELSIFNQNIPKRDTDEDDPFPYCVIRLVSGTHNAVNFSENSIQVLLIFGLWDSDLQNTGDVTLSIFNRIVERFSRNNLLKTFSQEGKIEWAIDDEDTYPYFFAGMNLTFVPVAIPGREMMFT